MGMAAKSNLAGASRTAGSVCNLLEYRAFFPGE